MGIIEIEGMEFHAYHGHFQSEQVVGNRFVVDLSLRTNCLPAAKTDHLEDALNYQEAYLIVKSEMEIASKLLENVAYRIVNRLFNTFPELEEIQVKVSKMNPPMGGEIEKVSVTLGGKRNSWL